jgi:ABC-2 type transport system permease protein
MKPATADAPAPHLSLRRGFDPRALGALFVLTLREHLRGRRLLVLSLLFALPSVLAVVVRLAPDAPKPEEMEFALVFNLIPQALVTLTTLLYAAGVIQDEVEEQTLTYLLVRPLPRWALYVTKLAATFVVTAVLTAVFTAIVQVVIWWDTPQLWGDVLPGRVLKVAALLSLAQLAYCALFGAIGLLARRPLVFGLVYIFSFEGLMANVESVARRLTVMYYFRVLAVRWLNPPGSQKWSIDLATAPTAEGCVGTLLAASALLVLLGTVMTSGREFRMKTPEGV